MPVFYGLQAPTMSLSDFDIFYESLDWTSTSEAIKDGDKERIFRCCINKVFKLEHSHNRGKYFIKEIEGNRNMKEKFAPVLEEIKSLKRDNETRVQSEIDKLQKELDNSVIRPSSIVLGKLELDYGMDEAIEYLIKADSNLDASWSIPCEVKRAFSSYPFLSKYHRTPPTTTYDERLDAAGSLLYAIDKIIKGTHDFGHCRIENKNATHDVVKALSATVNKLSSELSEAYLRGAKNLTYLPVIV